jgi:phage terminase large subunit-like protein
MTTKKATKQMQTLKSEALTDLKEVRKLVRKAIEDGATNVEQVHQAIAKMPLKYLEKIELIEDKARGVKKVQEKTIGQVYQLLRTINTKAADFTEEILKKVEGK